MPKFSLYSPRSWLEDSGPQAYKNLPCYMGNLSTRGMNEKSIRDAKVHASQQLDVNSYMKRHTVSQMSKMHQKLKKSKNASQYARAEELLDIQC